MSLERILKEVRGGGVGGGREAVSRIGLGKADSSCRWRVSRYRGWE